MLHRHPSLVAQVRLVERDIRWFPGRGLERAVARIAAIDAMPGRPTELHGFCIPILLYRMNKSLNEAKLKLNQ